MVNPVSRITGALGLLMMGAIAYQTVIGQVTLAEAGTRAAITLIVVMVVRRLGRVGMNALAVSMEREAAQPPQRRAQDLEDQTV
ncbi:MAG: hypothetical protein GY720_09770 [bacterium]|nr:hypothetical protein [bacterium]